MTAKLPAVRGARQRGVTLIELVCAATIIAILAAVAMPVANNMVKREKEMQLRAALREIRSAIDRFQIDVDRYPGIRTKMLNAANDDGYPEKLEWLYKGVDIGDAKGTKIKYLRRLPKDPLTGKADWLTRSSRDRPGSRFTDGVNIFDVHSRSEAVALDGTKYADW